jgi:hypothetical protein
MSGVERDFPGPDFIKILDKITCGLSTCSAIHDPSRPQVPFPIRMVRKGEFLGRDLLEISQSRGAGRKRSPAMLF